MIFDTNHDKECAQQAAHLKHLGVGIQRMPHILAHMCLQAARDDCLTNNHPITETNLVRLAKSLLLQKIGSILEPTNVIIESQAFSYTGPDDAYYALPQIREGMKAKLKGGVKESVILSEAMGRYDIPYEQAHCVLADIKTK